MASSRESSPDPLARSLINADAGMLPASSPIKTKPSPSPKRPQASQARVSTSPSKQQRTIIFSTPTKPRGTTSVAGSSPWHIKVTVEAEPDGARSVSPRKSRTTTVKVPLKDEDKARPAKRRRRTSDQDVIMSATPATAAGKRKRPTPGRYVDGLAPARRGRGRPRKSMDAPSEPSIVENADEDEDEVDHVGTEGVQDDEEPLAAEKPVAKRKGRRRKSVSSQIEAPPSRLQVGSGATTPAQTKATPRRTPAKTTPSGAQLSGSSGLVEENDVIDTSGTGLKAIKGRVATPRRPHDLDESLLSSVPPSSARRSTSDTTEQRPSPGNSGLEIDADDINNDDRDDRYCIDDEDETAMLDRSLAESEGFTMVSIESLRNQQQAQQATTAATLVNNSPVRSPEGFHVRKSPLRKATPRQSESSNILPTVEPTAIPQGLQDPGSSTNARRMDRDPFSAFRTGTRRQLRAGLAMGELLAESEPALGGPPKSPSTTQSKSSPRTRQTATSTNSNQARLPTPASTADNSSSPVPDVKQAIETSYTSTASTPSLHKHYDDMSWEPTTFIEARAQSRDAYDEMSWEPTGQANNKRKHSSEAASAHPGDSVKLRGEVPVSEPSAASASKSADKSGQTAGDIWLQEANSSLLDDGPDLNKRGKRSRASQASQAAPQSTKSSKGSIEKTPDLNLLLGDPDNRPTRGRIPRTWRRNSGNHFLYSDENPSPEQKKNAPATPLFIRDLRALEQVPEDVEGDVEYQSEPNVNQLPGTPEPTERSRSPLKGILSSPTRQRELQSPPKEVRFGKDAIREFEEGAGIDGNAQYFSSDEEEEEGGFDDDEDAGSEHSHAYGDADATIYNIDTSGIDEGSTAAQLGDVRQLRQELTANSLQSRGKKRSAGAAQLDGSADDSSGQSVLHPDPKKQYPRLFECKPAERTANHLAITPRRKPLPPTPRRPPPPSKSASQQTRGIFSRLAAWLYPDEPSVISSASAPKLATNTRYGPLSANVPASRPTLAPIKPGWNRNHYLVLESHWKAAFPTPAHVFDAEIDWHGTVSTPVASPSRAEMLARPTNPKTNPILPQALKDRLGTLIVSSGKVVLKVQVIHCTIAQDFMTEAKDRGIPLLSDGKLDVPSAAELEAGGFPRRDSEGNVVRVKEECDAWFTLQRVYGLWVRDVELAIEERKKQGREVEVRWPVIKD